MNLKPPVSPNAPLGTGQVYYNLVSDYGAVSGSSASLAINTLAFQKAVQAAGANGGAVYVPTGQFYGAFDIAGVNHIEVVGSGSGSVLHNITAADDALALTDCNDITIRDLRVQGTAGTRHGLSLARCPRARVERVFCQGTGDTGIYAEQCIGIVVDQCAVGIDSTSPYPGGVTNCTTGLQLNWDGVNADSGCNQFVINGGHYVIGKTQGWAVKITRAEGGIIDGPITELSKGGVLLDTCRNLVVNGYYGEANPSDVEYSTGTASTTSANTAVTGSGTAWNTNDGEGNRNAMVGKFLIIGTNWAQIASIGSDTAVTLGSNWPGSTASGQAYTMMGVDLYLKSVTNSTINFGRGGGAVLFESSSNNIVNLLTERIFFDANSGHNTGRVITNLASGTSSPSRLIDNGTRNHVAQVNYQTGATVQDPRAYTADMGAATLVAGTVTVATTAVQTGDRIFLSPVNTGGTAGFLSYTISNGVSFTVTSSSGTDTRTFNWMIVRPA